MPTTALALWALAAPVLAGGPPGHLITRVFGPSDGIVGGQIRALALDDEGALYVGTEAGVCRFDGQRCEALPAPPDYERAFVTELAWHDGALWVATRSGVYRLRDGEAKLLLEQPSSAVSSGFAPAPDGALWMAIESGLWRIEGDELTRLGGAPEWGLRAVVSDGRGALVGGAGGVFRWDGATFSPVSPEPVRALMPLDGGALWGTEHGIPGADGQTLPGSGECFVTDLDRLPDQRIVASCGEGMVVQNPEGDFEHIGRMQGLPGSIATRVAVDQDGQIWLGTLEHGLVRIANPDLRLWDSSDGFPSPHITAMDHQDGSLYIATRHGGLRIGPDLVPETVPVMGLDSPELRSVIALGEGRILWSRPSYGLVLQQNGQEKLYANDYDVGHLAKIRSDLLVGATTDEVLLIDLKAGTFEPQPPIDRGDGADMAVGPWGQVLFTSRAGLLALGLGEWTLVSDLPVPCSNAELLVEPYATWFACEHTLYSRGFRFFWSVQEDLGEGVMITQLARVEAELWAVTLDGLFRVEPTPLRISTQNGLPPVIFTSAMSPESLGGWLFASTAQGLLSLRPAAWERPRRSPKARIQAAFAGSRPLSGELELQPDEELLRLELSADSLADPELLGFRFRLDGGDWSEALDGSTLFLPGLPHGEHLLELQARYADSPWSAEPTPLAFRILPQWHERRSVQLAGVGALLAGVLFVRSERTRRLREELRRMEEQESFRQVFGRFVDPQIADEALSGRLSATGEKREVTVLFADIQGFTPLTESMEPHALVALLNRWLTAMVAEIEREGGVINKFAGDAVVAIFGAPLDQPDHADRAVRAAIGMRAAGHAIAGELERDFGRRVRAGIGVNSGEVIAGPVGAASRMEYTVIGEAVNVAARVEALTRTLGRELLITEATRRRLSGTASLKSCGVHALKGVSQPVEVWGLSDREE